MHRKYKRGGGVVRWTFFSYDFFFTFLLNLNFVNFVYLTLSCIRVGRSSGKNSSISKKLANVSRDRGSDPTFNSSKNPELKVTNEFLSPVMSCKARLRKIDD